MEQRLAYSQSRESYSLRRQRQMLSIAEPTNYNPYNGGYTPTELLEELLICGYIRAMVTDHDVHKMDRDVIGLCTKWFVPYLKSAQFVFDSFGVDDASRMQIINARTVKCLGKPNSLGNPNANPIETYCAFFGGSVRLKCALPTKNNANGVRSVFWECVPTKLESWHNPCVSFGVVSNRTQSFVNACCGLRDAYGVSLYPGCLYKGNPQNHTAAAWVTDQASSFAGSSKISIEYVVASSKLKFYRDDETDPKYAMYLPTNVPGITHWYPYVSLMCKDDECTVRVVHIQG